MSAFSVIVVIHTLAAIFGLITIVILCRQHASFFQKITTITAVCSFLGLLAYVFEILATNLEEALLATRFGYIGKSYAMVLFLIFIARYCDVNLPKSVVNTLLTFSTAMLFVVLTCPYHKLYYTSIEFVDNGMFPHLVLGKGVLYYVFMIVTLGVMFVFMAISVTTLFKREGEERRRLILLSLSGFVPAIALTLNLLPFMQGFDPTPMGILAACCLVTYNVLRHGLLDTMELASENVMDDTAAGLIVVSRAKNFVYANKMAHKIFPELRDEMQAKEMLITLFEDINDDNIEKKVFNRNGVIYELNYSVLKENVQKSDLGNNGYIAWVFDKTKDYNYTKELERLREKAEEANRSKSIFLAKMSHEIRTPMNGIMGFADLALENNLDRETAEYLHYIKDSSNSLLGIINDVLDISKIESGKMEIIDVEYNPHKLFEEIVTLFKSQTEERNIEFITSMPSDLPYVLVGDAIRFREILVNILGNAVKYTKQGKIYFIVDIKSKEDEITFKITIKDTGIGIKADKLDSIFNIFEQADNVGNYNVEGTGLGLSIAKQLTELMGGSISVKSDYGIGSSFTVILPQKYIVEQKQGKGISYHQGEYALVASNIKALLVDDNIINLKVEKGILERYGMSVELCESGEECLNMLKKDKYDVIFMDHMMPGMDGVATMKAIRSEDTVNVHTPILLITANAIVGVEQDMLKAGFDGFVSKPIDIKMLEKELLKVLPSDKLDIVIPDKKEGDSVNISAGLFGALAQVGVNVDIGLKYCGDKETYKEVLRIAVSSYKDKMSSIKSAFEAKDYENYRILVHSLKSGAANVGATKLSDMAKELEYAAKDNRIEFIEINNDEMLKLYENIIDTIRVNLLQEDDNLGGASDVDKLDVLQNEWEEKLKSIEYLLAELEIDEAQEIAKELLFYNVSYECQVLLGEMIDLLNVFDVEGAKARLVSLNSVNLF